jgi:hypothetical protein
MSTKTISNPVPCVIMFECDKCGKQETKKDYYLPGGWTIITTCSLDMSSAMYRHICPKCYHHLEYLFNKELLPKSSTKVTSGTMIKGG